MTRPMIDVEQLADPVVRAFVAAVNAGDRDAFFALLAPGATMSDDGSERNLEEWVDREIFSSDGRMEVESEKPIPSCSRIRRNRAPSSPPRASP